MPETNPIDEDLEGLDENAVFLNEEDEEEEEESPPKKKESRASIKKRLRQEEEHNLVHYLRSLTGGDITLRTVVMRVRPTEDQGTLDSFDEPLGVEDIKEMYGGGVYDLRFYMPDTRGSWEYITNRRIKIAGKPRSREESENNGSRSKEEPSVVKHAMDLAQQTTLAERERAERIEREAYERSNRPDPSIGIVAQELAASRAQAAEDRRVLYDLMNKRPETSPTDHLFSKYIDGESSRITQLRAQHESELRMKSEMHRDEIERIHARYEQNMGWQQSAHQREVETLRMSLQSQEKMLEASYRGQIRALERELDSARGDLQQAKAEIAELRAKKDKGLVESLTELSTVREALDSFGGGKEEGGSTIERIVNGVMGSPLAEGMANRLAGGAAVSAMGAVPQPPQPPQAQGPDLNDIPVNQPFQLPNGQLAMRRPDGSVVALKRKAKPGTGAGGGDTDDIRLDPSEVVVAAQFMENALQNDVDPESFAATARNVVPSDILGVLKKRGVDYFLKDVAKLPDTSPLLTMHGKEWARKVATALIG